MKVEIKKVREIWKKVVVEMYGEGSKMWNIFYIIIRLRMEVRGFLRVMVGLVMRKFGKKLMLG